MFHRIQIVSRSLSRVVAGICLILLPAAAVQSQTPAPARQSGTVKAIDGTTLTILNATGVATPVAVSPEAPVLQMAPGVTDLKTAQPIKLSDIVVGDRVITGKTGDAATASRVIVIKAGDIAARNQAEQADWQRRGAGGIVKSVDGAVVSISSGAKVVQVETTSKTSFRRYASDSIRFQDSTAGTLAQVHPGDQLSVRGDKSADGATITAEEVVTGTFSNLSGVLTAADPAAGTVTFKDLTSRKPVTVKVTANSDVRKLPPQMAAGLAARSSGSEATAPGAGAAGAPGGRGGPAGPGGAGRARAGMDLSRMLSRLPTATVADLHAGDAVMIVASPSAAGEGYTAITILAGVEALLTAPAGAAPITLSPWNLGAPEPGGGS